MPVDLTNREMEIMGWYIEGRDQHEMGDFLGLSRRRVGQIIAEIQRKFERRGVAMPKPWRSPFAARHVRQLYDDVVNSL